jgi:hypothetical protein
MVSGSENQVSPGRHSLCRIPRTKKKEARPPGVVKKTSTSFSFTKGISEERSYLFFLALVLVEVALVFLVVFVVAFFFFAVGMVSSIRLLFSPEQYYFTP